MGKVLDLNQVCTFVTPIRNAIVCNGVRDGHIWYWFCNSEDHFTECKPVQAVFIFVRVWSCKGDVLVPQKFVNYLG